MLIKRTQNNSFYLQERHKNEQVYQLLLISLSFLYSANLDLHFFTTNFWFVVLLLDLEVIIYVQPFIIKIKAYVFSPKCWLIKLKNFFLQSLNAWRFLLVALKVCIFLFNTFFTYLIYFLHFSLVSIFYCYIFCHLFSHNFRRPCLIFLGLARNYTSFRFLFFIRIFCCMPSNCVS